MSYIGKTPTVGNFIKLDALTASATASYTMQHGGVNFQPESALHMLVSLNGAIQSPNTSFTISGSTITFSSALTSSDSIDFIIVYGNVLDIGTPSDGTVTDAKANFVSTSSAAGLQIKGDGTTDGTLQLNCSQNSHGIKLKSPAHSAGASYTLTFPTTDGNADEFLKTDGSGALSWATAGGDNTPSFKAQVSSNLGPFSANTWTDISFNTEQYDTDNAFNGTTFTVPETGKYFFAVQLRFQNVPVDRQVQVKIDGASQNAVASQGTESADTTVSIQALGFAVLLDHNQGNNLKVQIFINGSNSMTVHTESWFCGFKLIGV